jgi:hypothetical protein
MKHQFNHVVTLLVPELLERARYQMKRWLRSRGGGEDFLHVRQEKEVRRGYTRYRLLKGVQGLPPGRRVVCGLEWVT